MTLDLPAALLADRVAGLLVVSCALALEAVLARHPGSPAGLGLALGMILSAWQWRRTVGRPLRLSVDPSGVFLLFEGAVAPVPAHGPRTRVLGRTVVLDWCDRRGPGWRRGSLWLTPADVPADALRALRVALVTGRAAGR
jgi:hypothetical protein